MLHVRQNENMIYIPKTANLIFGIVLIFIAWILRSTQKIYKLDEMGKIQLAHELHLVWFLRKIMCRPGNQANISLFLFLNRGRHHLAWTHVKIQSNWDIVGCRKTVKNESIFFKVSDIWYQSSASSAYWNGLCYDKFTT